MVTTKEIAIELMKVIQPKLVEMQKQIDVLEKKVDTFDSRLQSISSVIINKRKHGQ